MFQHLTQGAAAPGPVTATSDEPAELGSVGGFRGQERVDSLDCAGGPAERKLTPRQRRALRALLAGPVTREDMDRIVGASNGPDEIMKLRRRFGMLIPCERQQGFDRDGHRVEFGVYRLAPTDRQRAVELVHGGAT